jgi:hypothetical protein
LDRKQNGPGRRERVKEKGKRVCRNFERHNNEFKLEFEFKQPKAMDQHECNNKFL